MSNWQASSTYSIALGACKELWVQLEGFTKTFEQLPSTLQAQQWVLLIIHLESLAQALEWEVAQTIGYG